MTKYFYSIIFLFLFFTSCSVADVSADYDRNVDFSQYKTYNYYTNIAWGTMNELNQTRILNSIDKELASKGLVKTESPDLLLDIMAQEKMVKRNSGNIGVGTGSFGRHSSVGVSVGIPISSKKLHKNYVIEMVDANTDHLVWQGVFTQDVSPNADNAEVISKAIQKLLNKYPPAP